MTGRKSSPVWRSSSWSIPTAGAASNTSSPAAKNAARKKPPCSTKPKPGCWTNFTRSTTRSANDPPNYGTWYIQLTQAEECFRISKSDLSLRPVFHQKTERVDAHILVCFLALVLWRTLEAWMRGKGLGDCCRQLVKEVSTVRMMDVVLPVVDAGELRLRVVSRPDDQVAQLLARLDLELPCAPKMISDVVSKMEGSKK